MHQTQCSEKKGAIMLTIWTENQDRGQMLACDHHSPWMIEATDLSLEGAGVLPVALLLRGPRKGFRHVSRPQLHTGAFTYLLPSDEKEVRRNWRFKKGKQSPHLEALLVPFAASLASDPPAPGLEEVSGGVRCETSCWKGTPERFTLETRTPPRCSRPPPTPFGPCSLSQRPNVGQLELPLMAIAFRCSFSLSCSPEIFA